VGSFGISHDMTERLAAEIELRDRARTLSSIIDNSPSALSIKDTEGLYALANPNLQRVLGKPQADIAGKSDFELFPEETARRLRANDELVIRSRTRHSIEEELPSGGAMRTYMSYLFPIFGGDGGVRYVCRIALDITQRKATDEALKKLNGELLATLETIPDLLFVLDEQGTYVEVRGSRQQLLAAPAADLLGNTVARILPAEAAETVMDSLAEAGRNGSDYGRTMCLPLPEGGPRWFELSTARLADRGARPHFIMLSRDITARKRAEEALRLQSSEATTRNRELERFNRAMVDRELMMVDLKRRINALSAELGRAPPYSMAFDKETDRGCRSPDSSPA